jgi:hypothetical protein
MAGLKHVAIVPGQIDQACGEIRRLRPDEIEKTLNFIYSLVAQRQETTEEPGKPEDLLEQQNRWTFNEGERARLLDELRRMRRGERE